MGFAALSPETLAAIAFAFGLLIGSFLNVVVYRLPRGESLWRPGSHCPGCATPVAPRDNVPLLSYLLLRGRCRHCGVRISLRYPAVELATGLLFAAVALRHGAVPMTLVWLAFAAALLAAALIDLEHRIIPDEISLGGLLLALVVVPWAETWNGASFATGLSRSATGAFLGGGAFWLVGFLHARLSVAMGRRFEHWPEEGLPPPRPASIDYWVWFPGLGFGDVKLIAMIGAVLGPVGVLETIVAGSLAGIAFGLVWVAMTRKWSAPFGFGPALAAGALLVLLVPHPPLI